MKHATILTFAVFSLFIFMSFASASGESFYITDKATCTNASDFVVMGLTGTTNAHGELATEGNYNNVLCANFGNNDFTCNGDNVLVRLTASTDGTAQAGDYDAGAIYPVEICYGDVDYRSTSGTCDQSGEFSVLSLTGETNAHVGSVGDYPITICGVVNEAADGPGGDTEPDISEGDKDNTKQTNNIKQIKNIDENFINTNPLDFITKDNTEKTSTGDSQVLEGSKKTSLIGGTAGVILFAFVMLLLILLVLLLVVAGRKR